MEDNITLSENPTLPNNSNGEAPTLDTIGQWFTHCMQSVRRNQGADREEAQTYFIYRDRQDVFHYYFLDKNNKLFSQTASEFLEKNEDSDKKLFKDALKGILEEEIVDRSEAMAYSMISRNTKQSYGIILLEQKVLDDVITNQNSSVSNIELDSFISQLSTENQFRFIFFHEFGHNQQSKKQLEKTLQTTYSRKIDFRHTKGSENVHNLLSSYTDYKRIRMNKKLLEIFTKEFEKKGLSHKEIAAFYKFQKKYNTLQREMYADCFACIVANQEFSKSDDKDLINYILNLAVNRERTISGSHFINPEHALYFDPISHYTKPALLRLTQIIGQRRIEVDDLQEDDIHDLCQEASVYGFTHFLKECCLANPNYEKFLDTLSVRNIQPQLFNDLSTEANLKDNTANSQNYTLSQLFNEVLDSQDIAFSTEKAILAQTLFNLFQNSQIKQNPDFNVSQHLLKNNLTNRSLTEIDSRFEEWQNRFLEFYESSQKCSHLKSEQIQSHHYHLAQMYAGEVIEYKKFMNVRASRIFRGYVGYDENGVEYPKDNRKVEQLSLFDKISQKRKTAQNKEALESVQANMPHVAQNNKPSLS